MSKIITIENFLSEQQCSDIITQCLSELVLKPGEIVGDKKNARKSNIGWIDDVEDVNTKLKNVLMDKIKINGFTVSKLNKFQFTEYKDNGFYEWHIDKTADYSDRFYSTVIQLNNEYEGAELQIVESNIHYTAKKGVGNLFLFPSEYLHRVTPITSGIRYSLVNWVELEKLNKSISLL